MYEYFKGQTWFGDKSVGLANKNSWVRTPVKTISDVRKSMQS